MTLYHIDAWKPSDLCECSKPFIAGRVGQAVTYLMASLPAAVDYQLYVLFYAAVVYEEKMRETTEPAFCLTASETWHSVTGDTTTS